MKLDLQKKAGWLSLFYHIDQGGLNMPMHILGSINK